MSTLKSQTVRSPVRHPLRLWGRGPGRGGLFTFVTVLLGCLITGLTACEAAAKSPSPLDYCDITKPEFFPILPWDPYHGWAVPNLERGASNGLQGIADCN